MATNNDVNTPAIALVGFISALLLFAIIILLEVMFYRIEARDRYEKDFSQPPAELTALVQQQQARLAEYRWVDEKKGVVAIPIDRAMELVVAELKQGREERGKGRGKKEHIGGPKGTKYEVRSAAMLALLSPLSLLLSPLSPLLVSAVAERTEPLPPELVDVGITELPGARLPLELPFADSDGQKATLGQFFDGVHPVILTMNYSDCPMLCSIQLNGLVDALTKMPWNLGDQFRLVTVSIDPLETPQRAALTREKYLKLYNRAGSAAGWHFLTGQEEDIKKLAATVGFRYKYIPQRRQFAHAAALILCTPDGRVSRYLGGVVYNPQTLRLSLVEASEGKVGSTLDQFFLSCFHYDEKAGRYGPFALGIMRIGGGLTLLTLGGVLAFFWIREGRRRGKAATEGTP